VKSVLLAVELIWVAYCYTLFVCKHDVISKTGSTQFRQNKPVARATVIGNAHENNYGEIGLVVPEKFSWTGMQTDRHARSSQYAASLSAAE